MIFGGSRQKANHIESVIKKLRNKYERMPITVRASLLFAICGVLQKGISVIVVPIYTRIMPSSDYGIYSVYFSWYQLLMIFTTLNMWNYLINNGITEYKERRWDFIAALQGLSTVITLVWLIVYILGHGAWEEATGLTVPMMIVMFLELFTMPTYEYWCSVKRYDYEIKGVVITSLLITASTPIFSIPLIFISSNKGLAAIVSKGGVSIAVYTVVMIMMLHQNHKRRSKLYNKEFWRYALKFNLPLIPHFLSMMVLQSSDRIMIERMCGPSDTAIYSVAYQASTALSIFNSAILNTFIPYTYRAIRDGQEEKVGRKALPLVFFIGMMNFAATLLAPEIIGILAPKEYQKAIYAIPPVAMSNLLMFLFNLFANIEYYYKETKLVALASTISAVTNIILNYIFIKRFGFIAAAYTTVVCYLIFSFCHYVFMRRVSKKYMNGKRIYDMSKMTVMVGIFLVASIMVSFLYAKNFMVVRYLLIVIIATASVVKRNEIKRAVLS